MTNEVEESSVVSRRSALKKGAVAGGALLWVAPAVQVIGLSQAHAQVPSPGGGTTTTTTTPDGKSVGISFIAFRFRCEATTYFAKAESITAAGFACDGPNMGDNCGVDTSGAEDGCGLFTLSGHVFIGGELAAVTVNLTCSGGVFLGGSAKTGQGGCIAATATGTFVAAP